MSIPKPIHRSPLRMWLGKRYFIMRRYLNWYFGHQNFAKQRLDKKFEHLIFEHQTPLLRQLKNLDMYLQHNKVTNLKIALKQLQGIIIAPGETFSFWYLVGNTTRRKGYLPGMMLRNGKIVEGTGGGLCQLSNLIFWIILHSPLTVTERWRHSYDVFPDANRTQPFGSGATLSYNYVDLQFKNETKQKFQLLLWLTSDYLHGNLVSDTPCKHNYQIEERNHKIVGEVWGGFSRHNQIFRKTIQKNTGQVILEEPVIENHAIMMYQPFLE